MLKRPSLRRKSGSSLVQLNLVPILDTLVTLIAFLLFSMSFLALVHIESPFPKAALDSPNPEHPPLQLTLSIRPREFELWSPFNRFKPILLPADPRQLHSSLVKIKSLFPEESSIVLAPTANIPYDVLIQVMDEARMLNPTDPPFYGSDPQTKTQIALKTLFPNIVFGNLLSVPST